MRHPLALLLLLFTALAPAEEPQRITGLVGLDELLIVAEQQNPEIAAARRRVEAATGRVQQDGLYPNPALEYEEGSIPAFPLEFGEGSSRVRLGQPVVIGGRLTKAREAARAAREVREQELRVVRHRLYGEVHRTWVEILYLQRTFQLQWELINEASGNVDAAAELLSAGTISEADHSRVEYEAAVMQRDLLAIITARSMAMLRLQRLLGGARLNIDQVLGVLESNLDPREMAIPTDRTIEEHPELLAAELGIKAATARTALARREWIPDVTLSAIGGYNRAIDETFVGAGIGLPIPLFNRNQGRIAEAAAEEDESRDGRTAVELLLREQINGLLQTLNETDTIVSDYRSQYLPLASRVYTTTRGNWSDGTATTTDLLDAQRTHFNARREELQYLFLLNDALAQLRHFRLYAPVMETTTN